MSELATAEVVTTPDASAASTARSNGSSGAESVGTDDYQVSADDLADMGLSLDDGAAAEIDITEISAEVHDEDEEDEQPKVKTKSKDKEITQAKPKEEDPEQENLDELIKELGVEEEETTAEENDADQEELVVNGKIHTVPKAKLKELAQMGMDYTQKTQALAEEKKQIADTRASFEKEQSKWMQENQQKLIELESFNAFFDDLSNQEPEIYQAIEERAKAFIARTRNPVVEREVARANQRNQELEGKLEQVLTAIERQNYERQMNELKDWHQSRFEPLFKKAGIKFDEQQIQSKWIESGKPLKEIYKELWSDKILMLAKSKDATQKLKTIKKDTTPTAGKPRPVVHTGVKKRNMKEVRYDDIANDIIKQLALR